MLRTRYPIGNPLRRWSAMQIPTIFSPLPMSVAQVFLWVRFGPQRITIRWRGSVGLPEGIKIKAGITGGPPANLGGAGRQTSGYQRLGSGGGQRAQRLLPGIGRGIPEGVFLARRNLGDQTPAAQSRPPVGLFRREGLRANPGDLIARNQTHARHGLGHPVLKMRRAVVPGEEIAQPAGCRGSESG